MNTDEKIDIVNNEDFKFSTVKKYYVLALMIYIALLVNIDAWYFTFVVVNKISNYIILFLINIIIPIPLLYMCIFIENKFIICALFEKALFDDNNGKRKFTDLPIETQKDYYFAKKISIIMVLIQWLQCILCTGFMITYYTVILKHFKDEYIMVFGLLFIENFCIWVLCCIIFREPPSFIVIECFNERYEF